MDIDVESLTKTLPKQLKNGQVVHLRKNSVIFYKGEVTTHAYFVLSGNITVQNTHSDGNTYLITDASTGSFLCDLEIISGELINAATLITQTDCMLLKFTASTFLNALKLDSEFLFLISQKLAQKMYRESYRLGDNLFLTGLDRLKVYLVNRYCENGNRAELVLQKTRQVIASEVGVSVKTINRGVKHLAEKNFLEIYKGKIYMNQMHYESLSEQVDN
ncbi:Crp/Fnr family transcriptional regulator [Vibrio sp. DW001]|uniref:Crp/Fnr family transcriptional regulator n=1 Tax=Vibrio sp. DW001 TaxID=2912315 RepID=UPI0023B1D5A0|nr:Crp/Fnr family transcriptional regulator [Vibrio sp. DW001]WED27178.1 Crp/Fnr family transcriptional regulator [Vibrio sp. DW001]